MLVLLKRVGLSPEVKSIAGQDSLLDVLQETVDGYIESVSFDTPLGRFAVICNEDGRLMGLPYNCTIEGVDFVGDVVIAGIGEDDFTDTPERVIHFFERVL